MSKRYRIHNAPVWWGKPVVQVFTAESGVWADVGEPCSSEREASEKLQAILRMEREERETKD